jgi:O-antigen/teichoic acid export membrane protein
MTAGMGLRLLLQMLSFVIVAGSIGAGQFGAFASVAALVAIVSAFSGWGAEQLIVRRVARNQSELPQSLGSGLAFVGLSAPPLAAVTFLLVPLLVDSSISWRLIACVAIADIFFAHVNSCAAACYQAVDRPIGAAGLNLGFTGARVAAAALWVAVAPVHDALSWGDYYLAASSLAGAVSLWRVYRDLGRPVWQIAWADWRDGFHFSLQQASFAAFGNIDKPVVVALSNLQIGGQYAAASRIADAALVPVRALIFSTYARFFQAGAEGPRASARLAVKMLPVGVGLGAIGSLGILVVAPIAPWLLGHSYAGTGAIMSLLSPLPVLYAFYYLGADVLVSSGHTALRTLVQIVMPPINVVLCGIFVPAYGATGAAIAAVLTGSIVACAAWAAVGFVTRQSRTVPVVVEDVRQK